MSALKPFIWENGIAADSLNVSDVVNSLDIKSFFSLLKHPEPSDSEQVIGTLQLHGAVISGFAKRLAITNMGAILFAKDIETFPTVSRKTVRVVRYEGRAKSTTIKEMPGRKGYASGFNALIKYITDALPQEEAIVGGLRVCLRMPQWTMRRHSKLPMATWIMAVETSMRFS